jgi:hypothetical protein
MGEVTLPGDAAGAVEDVVQLSADEAQAVAEIAFAYSAAVPPGRDEPYRLLASAAEAGQVSGEHVAALERICALALETGKARSLGRAETERLINAVYRRTPAGRALAAEANDVNRVLSQLAGRELTSARLSWRQPGRYSLDLGVAGVDIRLDVGPEGLQVHSLQAG